MTDINEQHWQEVDGNVMPPEPDVVIGGQQPYVNRWELDQDHAEIRSRTEALPPAVKAATRVVVHSTVKPLPAVYREVRATLPVADAGSHDREIAAQFGQQAKAAHRSNLKR